MFSPKIRSAKPHGDLRHANSTCRVFEHLHKAEIKKAKEESIMTSNQLETIVHPNEYFKRSYLLKNLGKDSDVKMEQ
jgi:DNA primase large subunit